jgi:hypothetical protein
MRNAELRDAVVIGSVGFAIAAAPAIWSPRVWPDSVGDGIDAGGWLFLFAFSCAPFALVAYLRASGQMRRVAGMPAAVIIAALVLLGQVSGLDPNDPSSTASISLVTVPVFAGFVALLIWGGDEAIQALAARRRARAPSSPS